MRNQSGSTRPKFLKQRSGLRSPPSGPAMVRIMGIRLLLIFGFLLVDCPKFLSKRNTWTCVSVDAEELSHLGILADLSHRVSLSGLSCSASLTTVRVVESTIGCFPAFCFSSFSASCFRPLTL